MDGQRVLSKAQLPLAASVSTLTVGTKHVADILLCITVGEELGIEGKELCLGEKSRVGVPSKDLVPPNDCLLREAGVPQQDTQVFSAWFPCLAAFRAHP